MSSTLCTNGEPNTIGPNVRSSLSLSKKSLGYCVRGERKGRGVLRRIDLVEVLGHTQKKKTTDLKYRLVLQKRDAKVSTH